MKRVKQKIIIFGVLIMLVTSCEKDQCLTCNTYNLMEFTGEIESFYGTFFVCESDDMWDDIVWGKYNNGVGGDFSFIDLDEYTLGYRSIENTDIDDDGIINQYDDDIDNDGIMNYKDPTPYGIEDTSILELIICPKN